MSMMAWSPMANRYFVDPLPERGPAGRRAEPVDHRGEDLPANRGDDVVLADGRGGECRARIVARRRGELLVHAEPAAHVPPPRVRVPLAFAPPRLPRAD